MKKENPIDAERFNKQLKSSKSQFRRHQRDLPFGEKMKIAFSLAERDKTISRAVLLTRAKAKNK